MQLKQRDLQLAVSPKAVDRRRFQTPCEVITRPRDISKEPRAITSARRRVTRTARAHTGGRGHRRTPCDTSVTVLTLPHGLRPTSTTSLPGTPRTSNPWRRSVTSARSSWSKGSSQDNGSVMSARIWEPVDRFSAISPRENQSHARWDGHVVSSREYEVLMNKWRTQGLQWVACSDGQMCSRAIQSGHTRSGEPVYIARALSPVMTPGLGTFRPSTGLCYLPWHGREVTSSTYELLCHPSRLPARAPMTMLSPSTIISPVGLKILTLRNPVRPSSVATFRV